MGWCLPNTGTPGPDQSALNTTGTGQPLEGLNMIAGQKHRLAFNYSGTRIFSSKYIFSQKIIAKLPIWIKVPDKLLELC